jgi:hypothetical protein
VSTFSGEAQAFTHGMGQWLFIAIRQPLPPNPLSIWGKAGEGGLFERIAQQRLKQPLDGSTGSPRRLPPRLGHAPAQTLDTSTSSVHRPRHYSAKNQTTIYQKVHKA